MNSFKITNKIELINSDCLKALEDYEDDCFDVCITDPPYNLSQYKGKKQIGWLKSNKYWKETKKFDIINEKWDTFTDREYEIFTKQWLEALFRVLKPNANILIFGTYHNIFLIGNLLQKMDKRIINSIVWYKRNAFPNITQRMLCESTEYLIWAVNNSQKDAKNWTFNYDILKKQNDNKQMRNVWDIPFVFNKNEKKFGKHPAQKPVSIIERLIIGFTKEDDRVLDIFSGSGTIPIVSFLNNRKSTGIEMNKEYFDSSVKRLKDVNVEKIDSYL